MTAASHCEGVLALQPCSFTDFKETSATLKGNVQKGFNKKISSDAVQMTVGQEPVGSVMILVEAEADICLRYCMWRNFKHWGENVDCQGFQLLYRMPLTQLSLFFNPTNLPSVSSAPCCCCSFTAC